MEQGTASLLKLEDKYGLSKGGSHSGVPLRNSTMSRNSRGTTTFAIADFAGERSDELTFFKGDKVIRLRSHDSDWDVGICNGKEGMYPRNFVR